MVKLQIDVEEDMYYKLLKLKGTKRSWVTFLKEEILDKNGKTIHRRAQKKNQ